MNGYKFNDSGEIVPVVVNIVWGSPASGKSTYVKNNMKPQDILVDLDLIKRAISSQTRPIDMDNVTSISISIRDHLYSKISNREVCDGDVWVIACLPKTEERDTLKAKLKADNLIHIKATEQECYDRVMKDKERTDKEREKKLIYKWFKQFNYEW